MKSCVLVFLILVLCLTIIGCGEESPEDCGEEEDTSGICTVDLDDVSDESDNLEESDDLIAENEER